MAEVELHIGGRTFRVACADGEERALEAAAAHLAREAKTLTEALGKVPESRMLLMSGLMLADRQLGMVGDAKAAEEKHRVLEQRAERAEAEAARLREAETSAPPQPDMFPAPDTRAEDALEALALELETLAEEMEAQAGQ